MDDKIHWYDGWFYDKFIAPNQDATFRIMSVMIEENSSVLDVGCGTGRFVFQAADKCETVVGVDLSSRNIKLANTKLEKSKLENVSFIHVNADSLKTKFEKKFDYATISYVIHEMDYDERIKILNDLKTISNKIIIADYFVPQPINKRGISNRIAEFLAGKDHFNNFLNFNKHNGIYGLAEKTGLEIVHEKKGTYGTSLIVKLK